LLLLSLNLFSFFSFGQRFLEKADGETAISNVDYLNASLVNNKESAATEYIRFYQNYISEIRGQECPMYPSCSNFGLKAFKEAGFAKGFLIVSDRLMRCGHERNKYSLTLRSSGFRYLDYPSYDQPPSNLIYKENSYFYAYADTVKDSNPYISLIKSLINDAFYSEALLEIKRQQFSKSTNLRELFINELICLKALGEYEKAIYAYEMRCPETLKKDPETLYQLALNYWSLDNTRKALQITKEAINNTADQYLTTKLYSFIAVLHAKNYDWQQSIQAFKELEELPFPKNILKEKLSLLEKTLPLKEKRPALAAAMSVIPGAGYAYSGHKQTALSAFIINGLLTYATYSNIKSKNYGMAMLTGTFNLSFYIGNIYGASKSAKRFNERQKQNLSNKLIYHIQP
jgi:putative component of membrane protein insertase Oxa1/YidC/SpoIIIJ protein YidD